MVHHVQQALHYSHQEYLRRSETGDRLETGPRVESSQERQCSNPDWVSLGPELKHHADNRSALVCRRSKLPGRLSALGYCHEVLAPQPPRYPMAWLDHSRETSPSKKSRTKFFDTARRYQASALWSDSGLKSEDRSSGFRDSIVFSASFGVPAIPPNANR